MRATPVLEQIGYKAIAFLANLTDEDVAAMPPARRRQLVDWCMHWAKRAEPAPPKSGVLADLRMSPREG